MMHFPASADKTLPAFLTTPNGARHERDCVIIHSGDVSFANDVLALYRDEVFVLDCSYHLFMQAVALTASRVFAITKTELVTFNRNLDILAQVPLDFTPSLIAANDQWVLLVADTCAWWFSLQTGNFETTELAFKPTAVHAWGAHFVARHNDGYVEVLAK